MAPQEMDFPPFERAQKEDFLRIHKVFSSEQLPSSGRGCHAGCTQNRPPATHLEGMGVTWHHIWRGGVHGWGNDRHDLGSRSETGGQSLGAS